MKSIVVFMAGGIHHRSVIGAPGLAWILLLALCCAPASESEPPDDRSLAVVLHLDGPVGPAVADYLAQGLRAAADRGAAFVVLRIDTPGGLDTSMRRIIRDILASPVPVAAYVSPSGARAASAGTYILYASHIAAMAPGTNLGAATPVAIGGPPFLPGRGDDSDDPAGKERDADKAKPKKPVDPAEKKAINDAVAYLRSLAELRERNADWAEKAVREGASLSASQALKQNVIDLLPVSVESLLEQADGRTVKVGQASVTLSTRNLRAESIEPSWRYHLLSTLTNPNVALILMMIGVYGLIFEFMSPGAVYPGVIGAICLLVGLYALAVLPVNYAGLALLILGMALIVGEAVSPSFGALGIGGAIALGLGAAFLIDTRAPAFAVSWPVILGIAASGLLFALVVMRMAVVSRRHRIVTGVQELIGSRAEVISWQEAEGKGWVYAHGERWQAISESRLSASSQVRVLGLKGLILQVEPLGNRDSRGDVRE